MIGDYRTHYRPDDASDGGRQTKCPADGDDSCGCASQEERGNKGYRPIDEQGVSDTADDD